AAAGRAPWGGGVKGVGLPGGGGGGVLAEENVKEDVVEGAGPAGHDDIGLARLEFEGGQVNRRQRAGARRIDHAVRAAEVELVGDPPSDDVPQQPGEAILLPGYVRLGDPLGGVLGELVGNASLLHRP